VRPAPGAGAARRPGPARLTVIAAAAITAVLPAACTAHARPPAAPPSPAPRPAATAAASGVAPVVRVDQVGYPVSGQKLAYAMLPRAAAVSFTVTGPAGVVFRGQGRDLGRWNAHYPAVYALAFGGLARPGRYRITIHAAGLAAQSPPFAVGAPAALYPPLVRNAVRYFTSERDGPDVVSSVLGRQPANLTDARAYVYAAPRYDSNDNLLGSLHRIGGPVDVSGGWFDAGGGYEKFAYTTSYADGLLLLAARDTGRRYPSLAAEAGFGLSWLAKLWDPARKVLYIQAGIGNGNASNTIQGDYSFWFLPQAEDRLDVQPGGHPGASAYFVKYRPVFAAAPPGARVSPDLAGRMAADFALGAQLAAGRDRARAQYLLGLARGIYAMAQTSHVGTIVTTFPHDYYGGTEWRSDMLWGAAEIALAQEALGGPATALRAELATAAGWARAYLAQGHPPGGDTLNLYDTGAVGEAELLRAMRGPGGTDVMPAGTVLADLATQLRLGERWAHGDPFALGTGLGSSDATPHAFGLYVTGALLAGSGGGNGFGGFGQQQLDFVLGANPWGSSFVVGAGSTFPHCMQSEIANLAGSLSGSGDIQLGAVVDGPSSPGNFAGLGTVTGMRACHAGSYRLFDSPVAAYEDNVVSWPSVEPALDYAAISLLAFALAGQSPR
jgi:endoglucanase